MTSSVDVLSKIAMKESEFQANTISYPANTNARDLPHITVIELFKYSRLNMVSMETKNKQGMVILPLASNINYSDMHDWDEFDASSVGTGINAIYNNSDYMGAVKRLGTGVAKNILELIGKGSADSSFNSIQSMSGISINPMRANVYKSPKFREFQLEYNLVAKNQTESNRIKSIEKVLRYYASPRHTSTSGGFLQAPSIFQVSHWSSNGDDDYNQNNYLPKYLPSALVAINVDYNSTGDNYLHETTFAPIDVKITLAFKELEYDTKFRQEKRFGITETNLWNTNG